LSESALYNNIIMWAGMCLNALHMILWKWERVCFWMRFMWYY